MTRREFLPAATATLSFAASKKYRVALIGHTGRGNFGHDWDIAWDGVPDTEVVALADPVEAGRKKAMERSKARKAYADYKEMLRAEKPDIVGICPRQLDQRLEMITAAVDAGAHILVEKPLAPTLEHADRIVEMLEKRKLKMQVGHPAKPFAVTQVVLKMLRAGELGTLLEIRARGKEDRRAGGEDMMVLGTHDFDMMRLFAGDPESVSATIYEKGKPATRAMEHDGTEAIGRINGDDIAAMFRFRNGVPGYFASKRSEDAAGKRFGITLICTKASVYLPLSDVPSGEPWLMRSNAGAGSRWEKVEYPPNTLPTPRQKTNAMMAADLIEAIEKNRDPVCSARDARWTVEMVAGVYQSHYAQAAVSFPLKRRS